MKAHVARRVRCTFLGDDRNTIVALEVRYHAHDPWVMRFHFRYPIQEWTIGRELVDQAVANRDMPAGEGDVVFQNAGPEELMLTLRSPSGRCRLMLNRANLRQILSASYALVPAGEEHIDWDEEFARLGAL
ncbi:hypothetical protein GCM10012275_28760 [Longimycelium tulufanense]|uniref:Sporulation and cell division protein SsgA n=1 Tax=Longimycelium tulufanense TaxID=907463 RepID=A0A8J3FW14_9PSEU|nr:SsgA family sporulation/cell division regulator [Longimycelium tulufanense]GGM55875.1 hypothetical protein GCM10012275_28760 [Longimycelium tulufanense]